MALVSLLPTAGPRRGLIGITSHLVEMVEPVPQLLADLVERCFAELASKWLMLGTNRLVAELGHAIQSRIDAGTV